MVTVGIHDQIAEVSPLNPDYELTHQAPTVGSIIRYENEHTRESFMLKVRDSICAPAMDHNLTLMFAMREAGMSTRNTPKFQVKDV